jgi:hypothetical protein
MTFKEFIETISNYEYFPYSHIMEIPESSLAFAKTLSNDQWDTIYEQKVAIALCCKIKNDIIILFSSDCFKDNIRTESSIKDKGSIVIDKDEIGKIQISAPRNKRGEIKFSDTPIKFGQIEIISPDIKKVKKQLEPKINRKENLEDNFDFVINLRGQLCGHVSVDNKIFQIFEHFYKYLIRHNYRYFFSSDLINLIDAKDVLGIELNEKNITGASFISDDIFYYNTRETFTDYSDSRCGLISISKGEIINNNRYTSVDHFVGGNHFIVNFFENSNGLQIYHGLIDINGKELLPPIYDKIMPVIEKDKPIIFRIKKERKDNDFYIFEQDSSNLRIATDNDFN